MSAIVEVAPQLIATATLRVETPGVGFTDITENAASFIKQVGAADGALLVYLRHTSASLTIQENADSRRAIGFDGGARSPRAGERILDL